MSNDLSNDFPMEEDDASEQAATTRTSRVGQRLAGLREELGKFYPDQDWSQTAVGNRVGMTQNVITRMEHGKGGLMENWLKVLALYEQQGYNLHWILTENNKHVSKLLINEATTGQFRDELLTKLQQHQATTEGAIRGLLDLVENGPQATAEAHGASGGESGESIGVPSFLSGK
jgi:transcriptional regulator with XRE-family HTH domain